jgi:hypothetical protein
LSKRSGQVADARGVVESFGVVELVHRRCEGAVLAEELVGAVLEAAPVEEAGEGSVAAWSVVAAITRSMPMRDPACMAVYSSEITVGVGSAVWSAVTVSGRRCCARGR